jgi:hypothetical protein
MLYLEIYSDCEQKWVKHGYLKGRVKRLEEEEWEWQKK